MLAGSLDDSASGTPTRYRQAACAKFLITENVPPRPAVAGLYRTSSIRKTAVMGEVFPMPTVGDLFTDLRYG